MYAQGTCSQRSGLPGLGPQSKISGSEAGVSMNRAHALDSGFCLTSPPTSLRRETRPMLVSYHRHWKLLQPDRGTSLCRDATPSDCYNWMLFFYDMCTKKASSAIESSNRKVRGTVELTGMMARYGTAHDHEPLATTCGPKWGGKNPQRF